LKIPIKLYIYLCFFSSWVKQKEEALQREEEERKQKEEAQNNLLAVAKELLKSGMSIEKVHEITKIPIEELKKL
jgi:predicted transposase YdaD